MGWLKSKSDRGRVGRPGTAPALEWLERRNLPDAAGNSLYLSVVYHDLLGRAPDSTAQSTYGAALDQNTIARPGVALAVLGSSEYRTEEAQRLCEQLLGRASTPAEVARFLGDLGGGRSVEDFEAGLLGSAEYYQARGGGSNDGFLTALYFDLLGQPVAPGTRAFLDKLLARGTSRVVIATHVLDSDAYHQELVQDYYREFLGRPADSSGLAFFTGYLNGGGRDEAVMAALLGSGELYYNLEPATTTQGSDPTLTAAQVGTLLDRAAAATASDAAIVAIVDRNGNILGVRVEGNVSPAILGNENNLVFAIDGAVSLARTGAFFANDQAPLTSRTVEFISQSTNTQREVNSNPDITDQTSPLYGPGLVAPISVGGHFPPNVPFTPPVDLYDIELTNRDGSTVPGLPNYTLPNRFNVPNQYIPAAVTADGGLQPPNSYGYVTMLDKSAQSRGIATLPGGVPIFEHGALVGGIGVFFPGQTGYASAENSSLSSDYDPSKPDLSLQAEYIAFAALGGSSAAGYSIGSLGGVAPLPGFDLPSGRIDLGGITLPIFGPGGTQGPQTLAGYGLTLGQGNPNSGSNHVVDRENDTLLNGEPVPSGWLVLPHAGGGLSAGDVTQMIDQGIAQANLTRAAIRLPLGSTTRMVFAVSDPQGDLLGLYRMPDATIFSEGVAVAKARNVAYYDDPSQLQPADQVPGVAPGVAITSRTVRFLAQPRYPEGTDGAPPGPFSILNDGGSNPLTGLNTGAAKPASAFQSVEGYEAFHPDANFRDPNNPANQNGVVFFPGSSALYGGGAATLIGGLGVSGDGVTEDDTVTYAASAGFAAPATVTRADQVRVGGVRLPYLEFVRNPDQL
ncbi:MAG TPA: hypothetical protein VKA46_12880 [Gemmataceae bacterium]|nr:hypothetical protein [Gemmataceae bacterium]